LSSKISFLQLLFSTSTLRVLRRFRSANVVCPSLSDIGIY